MHLLLFPIAITVIALMTEASSITRNPISALSEVWNATIHESSTNIHALSHFVLTFDMTELHVKLILEPSHDTLNEHARITHLAPDGSVNSVQKLHRLQYKVFKGKALVTNVSRTHDWQEVGWARVLVIRDGINPLFEGAFAVNGDHHHIQLSKSYLRTRHRFDPRLERGEQDSMVLWRDSDLLPLVEKNRHQGLGRGMGTTDMAKCGADQLGFNADPAHPVFTATSIWSEMSNRSIDSPRPLSMRNHLTNHQTTGKSIGVDLVNTIGQTSGCPSSRKVASVGVATDCRYTGDFDSVESVKENVIQMINTASAVWEDAFNIALSLANLTISNASCPVSPSQNTPWNQDCGGNVNIQQRLNFFSAWRIQQKDSNSHWTLLTTCNTGSEIGLAWLGQACVNGNVDSNSSIAEKAEIDNGGGESTVSGANLVVRTHGTNEWQVFAHETGHTFGAVHDCDGQACSSTSNTATRKRCCPMSASVCDANAGYIMSPSSQPGIKSFSPCSIGNICNAIGRNSVKTDCLRKSSLDKQDSSWIHRNKATVIAVPSACAALIVFALLCYCVCRFSRRETMKKESLGSKRIPTDHRQGKLVQQDTSKWYWSATSITKRLWASPRQARRAADVARTSEGM